MITKSKVLRIADFVFTNSVWYTLAILGLTGTHWAYNVFRFLTWLAVIIWGTIAISPNDTIDELELSTVVPYQLLALLDLLLACIVVAFGHWFYAILIVIQMLCDQSVRERKRKLASKAVTVP